MSQLKIDTILEKDKYICQECGEKINIIADHFDPSKLVMETLSKIKEIQIYKWKEICCKCNGLTPVATYNFIDGFFNRHIGSTERLDIILMEKYPFVKRIFSNTREEEVIANVCVNCGALQGNYYIGESLFEMEMEEIDMDKYIDITIPNTLQFEDLAFEDENDSAAGSICFKDGNKGNTNEDNLLLLCNSCRIELRLPQFKYTEW